MKIAISAIKVAERIRKDVSKIDELAENILENGLISPIAVMPLIGEEYQLLAGLRRLRAVELNGETEIEANVIPAADAEAALKIEFSENEQREPFTFSEKMDYARLIEEIERTKAKNRKLAGTKIAEPDLTDLGAEGSKRETRSVVGAKVGMSGKQYDRAKFIADNAPPEVIDALDRGERSIRRTYDELRATDKHAKPAEPQTPILTNDHVPPPTRPAPPTPSPQPKVPTAEEFAELKAKYDEFFGKYLSVKLERDQLKTQLHNTNVQWQFERAGKDEQIEELSAELATANARIVELETALAAINTHNTKTETNAHATTH